MRTLQDDGVAKVLDGTTSLEELRRVVFLRDVSPAAGADRLVRALAAGSAD